jgi:putative tryptophan/tyrosine transport system substrate-binding protein
MRRRKVILGLLAVGLMGTAHAQQSGKVHRIVHASHPVAELTERSGAPVGSAIFSGLNRSGYVEGKNLLIERYSAEGRTAHYPADEAVAPQSGSDHCLFHKPDALFFKAATTTIPIWSTRS